MEQHIEAARDPLAGQPLATVERDGIHYTLLGTAHVSQASVDAVRHLLATRRFDAVAVELCEPRFQALTAPGALDQLDLFRVIREGKTGFVAANLALSAYQRRLAEQLGVEPGAEMRAAIEAAQAAQLPLWRVDRDVGVTLRRAYASVGFFKRFGIVSGLFASLFASESVDEDEIEKLKQGDMLESAFSEFARRSEPLYRALIGERDRYMAAALREHADERAFAGQRTPGEVEAGRVGTVVPTYGAGEVAGDPATTGVERAPEVLVVIGAGHLAGLSTFLAEDGERPSAVRRELSQPPPPGRLGMWLTAILLVFVLGGFAWGFARGEAVGAELVMDWVLATGGLGALGCLLAGGHPLSILAAFVATPLTPLHPALASGTVSALVEAWMRKPQVADFAALRNDVGHLRGWWRNRVARVFLNFFLTSLGTAAGVYIAGWQMLQRLF